MATEKVETVASTLDEALAAGFVGRTYSYPNEFHEASGEAEAKRAELVGFSPAGDNVVTVSDSTATDKGAVVNGPASNSPKPTGGRSGPGASTDTSNDDK